MSNKKFDAEFKVNTAGLLNEILCNEQIGILEKPIKIFGRLLYRVADRAAALNDPELNLLMCKLALYSVSDPSSDEYDQGVMEKVQKAVDNISKAKELAE
jgi:hypothetical protein